MAPSNPLFRDMRLPLICAPMFLVSYPELILAACKANIAAACSASTALSGMVMAKKTIPTSWTIRKVARL